MFVKQRRQKQSLHSGINFISKENIINGAEWNTNFERRCNAYKPPQVPQQHATAEQEDDAVKLVK